MVASVRKAVALDRNRLILGNGDFVARGGCDGLYEVQRDRTVLADRCRRVAETRAGDGIGAGQHSHRAPADGVGIGFVARRGFEADFRSVFERNRRGAVVVLCVYRQAHLYFQMLREMRYDLDIARYGKCVGKLSVCKRTVGIGNYGCVASRADHKLFKSVARFGRDGQLAQVVPVVLHVGHITLDFTHRRIVCRNVVFHARTACDCNDNIFILGDGCKRERVGEAAAICAEAFTRNLRKVDCRSVYRDRVGEPTPSDVGVLRFYHELRRTAFFGYDIIV